MTEAHISPRWYAAAGPSCLILTVLAAFGLMKALDTWENYSSNKNLYRQKLHSPDDPIGTNEGPSIKRLADRSPTLDSMRYKPQGAKQIINEWRASGVRQPQQSAKSYLVPEPRPSVPIVSPSELPPSSPVASNSNEKHEPQREVAHAESSLDRDRVSLAPQPQSRLEQSRIVRPQRHSAPPIERRERDETNAPRSSHNVLFERTTVGTASEFDRRLRIIKEESTTAMSQPSRLFG